MTYFENATVEQLQRLYDLTLDPDLAEDMNWEWLIEWTMGWCPDVGSIQAEIPVRPAVPQQVVLVFEADAELYRKEKRE